MAPPVSLPCFAYASQGRSANATLKETGFALIIQYTITPLWGMSVLDLFMQTAPALKSAFAFAFARSAIKLALLAPFRYAQRLIKYIFF